MVRTVCVLLCLMGVLAGGCTKVVWSGPRVEPLKERGGAVESGLYRGVPYVMASINGGPPRKFLFDTGATFNTISPRIAREIGLKKRGTANVTGASGRTKPISMTIGDRVEFGPVVMEDMVFILRDLGDIFPSMDSEIAGLIGIRGLDGFTVDIDYPNRSVAITDERLDPDDPDTTIAFKLESGLWSVPLIVEDPDAIGNHKAIWALLDSGNMGTFDLEAGEAEPLVMHEHASDGHRSIGIHGIEEFGQIVPLRAGLVLGDTRLEGMRASINTVENRLSSAELGAFRVKIDGRSGLISFSRSDSATRLVLAERFGIPRLWEFGGYRIDYVIAGSAADLLGISAFDRVLSINGQEPSQLHNKAAYWPIRDGSSTLTVRILRESDNKGVDIVLPVDGVLGSGERHARINPEHSKRKGTVSIDNMEPVEAQIELVPME